MASGFRSSVWDPSMILGQIVFMQCFFYVSMGTLLVAASILFGTQKSVDQLFNYHEFESVYDGWMIMVLFILNAFSSALALWWVVRRAKQCLDFSVTVYLIHTLICLSYGGFPKSFVWWITHVVCLVMMAITGEYLCMRTELAEIPLLSSGASTTGRG